MDYNEINQRLHYLDSLLRTSSYTKKELMDKLAEEGYPLSVRTLEYDMRELASKVDIKKTRGDKGVLYYSYENRGASYFQEIDTKMRMALERFFALAHSIQGLDKIQEIHEMERHFRKVYQIETVSSVMSFPKAELRPLNAETVEQLYNAITAKKVVQFSYESYNRPEEARLQRYTIHPYHLTEYNNRWYLTGYTTAHGPRTVIPTDRIRGSVMTTDETYIEPPSGETYDRLFEDRIGIGDGPKIDLKIAVGHTRFRYFSSRKLHPYQECLTDEETEDGRKVFLYRRIVENEELRQKLLSYGKEVEVLAPLSLRQKLQSRIEKMEKLYASPTHVIKK